MDTSQYMSMFLEESMDNLQTLNEALLQLEQNSNDADKLNEIFRVAHTIKGMAATMGFSKMAELTHKMEDILSEFRDGELSVNQNVVTILFKCLDTLEHMVNNISDGNSEDEDVDIDPIVSELQGISKGNGKNTEKNVPVSKGSIKEKEIDESDIKLNEYDINVIKQAQEKGFTGYHINIMLNKDTLLKSARAFLIFKNLEESGEIIKSVPCTEDIESENFEFQIDLVYVSTKSDKEIYDTVMGISEIEKVSVKKIDAKEEKDKFVKGLNENTANINMKEQVKRANKSTDVKKEVNHKKAHQSVRVELERLDKFMNMVSELVIHRTRLEQISANHKLTDLNETLEQVARTTSDLQDLVMKIRMLPLDTVFNRFPRMVRDLALELNKEIELVIEGQDTELDRTVIDEIGEPLIHLIRNSADHGIESKEERIRKGKNPVGKIRLAAYQEGTKAVIKVEDDGKGIDVETIREKAEEIGINTEGMSDIDIRNLIFIQGFSTSKSHGYFRKRCRDGCG